MILALKVITTTFDGAATNLSAERQLQCNLQLENFQTWFPHPVTAANVYIFSGSLPYDKTY